MQEVLSDAQDLDSSDKPIMNFTNAREEAKLRAELAQIMLGGKGGQAVFQNAIDNPLDTLLGGEGGTEEFQNIDWKSLLTGGKILE